MSLFRQRGDARQRPVEQENKNIEKNAKPLFARLCLVGSRCAFCMVILPKGVTKKHDDLVGIALLEALVERFMCFGESEVRPRHFQTRRIGGPGEGRETGNLPVTTPKPPVA